MLHIVREWNTWEVEITYEEIFAFLIAVIYFQIWRIVIIIIRYSHQSYAK